MATTNLISISYGDLKIQHGNGTPDHSAEKGTIYTDLDSGKQYGNIDGSTSWKPKLAALSDDAAPVLGGTLDTNGNQIKESKGSDVASAVDLALGSDGNYFDITGTTGINTINTLGVGTQVVLQFDDSLTLTHSASLILPTAANIITETGDHAIFREISTGVWKCIAYHRADGTILNENYRDYKSIASPSYLEGRTFYSADDKALSLYTDIAGVTHNLGQEFFVRVKNNTGGTITNGNAVYINGVDTDVPTINKAQADSVNTSVLLGLTTHDIDDGEQGFVTTEGLVKGLDTLSFSVGEVLYLSETVAGGWTNVSPPIRSIVGIVIKSHASDGIILVTNSKISDTNNRVVVRSLSDLPTPISNEIQLSDNVVYSFIGDVNIGINTLLVGSNTVLTGDNHVSDKISYTGTGTAIKAVDNSSRINGLSLSAPNGKLFDFEDTAGNEKINSIMVSECSIKDVDTIGSVKNLALFEFINNHIDNITTEGLLFTGSQCGDLLLFSNNVISFTGTFVDLGTSIWDLLRLDENHLHATASQVLISGAVSNGNLSANGRGILFGNNFFESGTYVSGITKGDTKWSFIGNTNDNQGIGDVNNSTVVGEVGISTPALTAVSDGVYTKIAGTTTLYENERVSMSSDMTIQYDGLETVKKKFTFIGAGAPGFTANYDFAIFLNGSIIPKSELINIELNSNDPRTVVLSAIIELVNGDQVDVRTAGNGTNNDVTFSSGKITLGG